MSQDLLLEIGVEELPASFVAEAVAALPGLIETRLRDLRLSHGAVRALGTPRRLALIVEGVGEAQPDLDEEVLGPPARVAFDVEGKPSKAAQSFASKIGVALDALTRKVTDKGEYVAGRRVEKGAPALSLLPALLVEVCAKIPFRKSMRWSDIETPFGRPVRWLIGLFGAIELDFAFAGVRSGRTSYGHRFLAPGALRIESPSGYVAALRSAHVLVDPEERKRAMVERLSAAAQAIDGVLIEDQFLVEENASLVEEPQVVVGNFEEKFLALPERVILDVAKGHQRYFGARDKKGRLLPKYLAVVGTALEPENIRRGNDRVMRARLADAKFFYDEDLKVPLAKRRADLDGILFHKRLGSVGDKVRRIEALVPVLGEKLGLASAVIATARDGAALAKCDLVALMVRELPELQGEMGAAYGLAQGLNPAVASVIADHYLPRGAEDSTAKDDAGALVALCDRLDTLVGCFAIGLLPTGAADPLALRRAAIGLLRTLLDKQWRLGLSDAIHLTYRTFVGLKLDLGADASAEKLGGFLRQRLRGVLRDPSDVVDACVAASADDPYDVALRAAALGKIEESVRASAGEVFKRAANIAREAPPGELKPPSAVQPEVHPSEQRVFDAFQTLKAALGTGTTAADYERALSAIAVFAPILAQFFEDIFVMVEEPALRTNRLHLMRDIHRACSRFANFNLLVKA
ncbi:MAG TPA: glycine--tRNA ligase subunit beta [Polyangiaceae bacterium]|jgi:glycyl-tRNA synthetase beta chain|nr:glycine--tRNA ligase subunit beta [Polyangiaceae bacterium]